MNVTTLRRMEYIDSIPFSENSMATLPTNGGLLPNDRFLHSLMLEFEGRLAMPGSGGPTAALGDSIAAIIERVVVEGYHRIRRQQEKIIDMRGADLEFEQRFYLPTRPIYTPSTISVTASANNDIRLHVLVPFVPLRMPATVQASYLLDCPNYESLRLQIQWADWKNLASGGTTAPTWSAYGSASGNPSLKVYGVFAQQAARFAGFVPGRLFRYFTEVTGSTPTTTASQARIYDVPRGFDLRKVFIKSGVKSTSTSAGNNAFASLSDFVSDFRFNIGLGKYIRRYLTMQAMYADLALSYNLADDIAGVHVLDFASHGSIAEALNTRQYISGPTGNVDVYLSADVIGAANQAIVIGVEELRYRPVVSK